VSTPDLLYSDIEEELRSSVRAMLADRSPVAAVLERCEGPEPYDLKLWRGLAAELGCAGLAVPEAYGGAGASFREVAVVLEELGRAVAPVPYFGSAVLATSILLACGETDLLAELAGGARSAALAVPFSTPPGGAIGGGSVQADRGTLSGTVSSVADALPADVLLVPVPGALGALYAVEAGDRGVTRTPVVSLDLTRRLCDLTLDRAPGRLIATGEAAEHTLAVALSTGAALLASELLGTAEWCLETTVEYVKGRHQFGRPVGSFQALKHRLADLWVEVSQARAVARYAAVCLATADPDTQVATALAKAHCSTVAVRAAEECVQLHGGIGFTWEHPAHLYLKRAKSASIALGTPDRHRAALAGLADLPAAAGR
jgi:alkylation response protein AidB-like acyl-CoA dehydrogenase